MSSPADTHLARAIFATTFVLYLLTSGREPPWGDGNIQYMVAESLVNRQALDIKRAWPDDLPRGRNGKLYSTYPILTSAVHVPGLLIFAGAGALSPEVRPLAKPLTSHLACAFFGALACMLFFRVCRQQGLARRASSLATAVLGVATSIWVYAHYSYSEAAQAAMFLGFVLHTLRFLDEQTPSRARWLGLYAGLLFSMKYIYAGSLAGCAALLAWQLRRRLTLPLLAWIAATAVPFALLAMVYNYLCWGHPITTGYHPYFESYWGENPAVGLWGMFLSPGKSVFLYSPPLVLSVVALPRLWREQRTACLTIIALALPVLLVYSRYKLNGDYAWGPRFVVFAVPAFMFGFAVLLDAWQREAPRRMRRGILVTVIAAGVAVQLLGLALYWDHFIRISMDARTAWLGTPNRRGAIIPVRADGRCDSCFEDIHQLEWLPPFQPILGHAWLLRSIAADRTATEAARDAPWRRHTSLDVDIAGSYARARIDWWGLLWLKDFPKTRTVGLVLLLVMLAGFVAGLRWWTRAHRATDGSDPP